MTIEQAKRVYETVYPEAREWMRSELDDMRGDMVAVIAADSDRLAAVVIRWWYDQGPEEDIGPLDAVRRFRSAWAEMQLGEAATNVHNPTRD